MTPTWTITKRLTWEAAHQLEGLEDDHPCGFMHGHSYKCELTLQGSELGGEGFLMDMNLLKLIRDRYDHKLLNEVMRSNPSVENLCYEVALFVNELIWKECGQDSRGGDVRVKLVAVTIAETENNTCTLTFDT